MRVANLRSMFKNRMGREEIYSQSDFWDSKASALSGKAVSMWPNNNLNALYHQEQLSVLAPYLKQIKNKRILDIGCGSGRISRFLASMGAQVVGIDFSAKTIEIAKSESPRENPAYRVQSVFHLNEDGRYDMALCWQVLTVACKTQDELSHALAAIHRSLKPQGAFVLLEPIHKGFLHRVLNMGLQEFIEIMGEVGFRVDEVFALHFWPTRLFLAFIPWPKPITSVGYHLGQKIMKTLFKNNAFGDYKAIYAKKE
jgi:2-polyprenyl-3-methyl-5-hydroxy-6-metoxy-1,4-benzoquinol methylase